MKHSDRIRWFELAYEKIREELVPEAPPGAAITIALMTKKKSGQNIVVGETHHECYQGADDAFGGNIIIALHPIQGDDLVLMLATLVHEMIHAALEPGEKHKKEFQKMAARVGLDKPWPATTPNGELSSKLRAILLEVNSELGFEPVGVYAVPPRPAGEKKKSASKRVRCKCTMPRIFTVTQKQIDQGPITCGVCREAFRIIEDTTSELDVGVITSHDVPQRREHEEESANRSGPEGKVKRVGKMAEP